MSLVGVLKQGDAELEIVALHVNYWALNVPFTLAGTLEITRRLGTRKSFIDIGVRFRVSSGTVGSLSLLLPSDAAIADSLVDLSPLVLDESTNDLIFGVVAKTVGNDVHYSLDDKDVVDSVVATSKIVHGRNGQNSLILDRIIIGSVDSPTYYVRVRLECRSNTSLLSSKAWALAKQGFVFRCLMNDVRATAEMREDPSVAARLLEIAQCFVFVVAPSDYVPALASPALHYSRLLEASVWKRYLRSCGELRDSHKYTIHQWRSTDQITLRKPFRSYMHLHREFGFGIQVTYVIGLLTVPVLRGLAAIAEHFGLWPIWW